MEKFKEKEKEGREIKGGGTTWSWRTGHVAWKENNGKAFELNGNVRRLPKTEKRDRQRYPARLVMNDIATFMDHLSAS